MAHQGPEIPASGLASQGMPQMPMPDGPICIATFDRLADAREIAEEVRAEGLTVWISEDTDGRQREAGEETSTGGCDLYAPPEDLHEVEARLQTILDDSQKGTIVLEQGWTERQKDDWEELTKDRACPECDSTDYAVSRKWMKVLAGTVGGLAMIPGLLDLGNQAVPALEKAILFPVLALIVVGVIGAFARLFPWRCKSCGYVGLAWFFFRPVTRGP